MLCEIRQILHDIIYMWNLKKVELIETEGRKYFAGGNKER